MQEAIKEHFDALEEAVRATSLPPDRQQRIAISIGHLSGLYAHFRETNESRYGDQITRLVQSVLKELESCPDAQTLDADFRDGLRDLHEELGVPALALKPAPAPPKQRKPRKQPSRS